MSKTYIGKPGEGRPVRASAGPREGVRYTNSKDGADEVVHLVDDGGRPLSKRDAEKARGQWRARTAHIAEPRSAPTASGWKRQVDKQRKAGRGSVFFWGLVVWGVGIAALVSGGGSVAGIIGWILLSPFVIVVGGYMMRGMVRLVMTEARRQTG